MVIGSGLIAKGFNDYIESNDIIIFASGVSNSKEIDKDSYKREEDLINNTIKNYNKKTIVYFSTCSIEDKSVNDTTYVKHKIRMEKIIENNFAKYYIFRLPQVVGLTTSPTLIYYLFTSIINHEKLKINENSRRNLVSIDDVYLMVNYLIKNEIYINETTNIASPYNMLVVEILMIIEKTMDKKASFKLINKGCEVFINIDKIKDFSLYKNTFSKEYIKIILKNYYIDFIKK